MEWIKVEDEKPRHEGTVLLYHEFGDGSGLELGFYDNDYNVFRDLNSNLPVNVSHWASITVPLRERMNK